MNKLRSDPDPDPDPDPWLTVAEIAEELRVNPATVRLWISKELLPAKRAGRRKLLIRRSDLDAMLRAAERAAEPPTAEAADDPSPQARERGRKLASIAGLRFEQQPAATPRSEDPLVVLRRLQDSDEAWGRAQRASEDAPPDPGFPDRLHDLALAAEGQGRALASAAAQGQIRWAPHENAIGATISYELRPGANRPGPPPLWAEFDRCTERLGLAMAGPDLRGIATCWHDLAIAAFAILDALDDQLPDAQRQRR